MKKYKISKTYTSVQQGDVDPNELIVKMNVPYESDVSRFEVGLHFDKYDDVKTIIISDKFFYSSIFYTDVIKTERYKEAWQILRQKYLIKDWIDKYLYFLMHAPPIIPLITEINEK